MLDNSDEKGIKICKVQRVVSFTAILLNTFQFARLMLINKFVKKKKR